MSLPSALPASNVLPSFNMVTLVRGEGEDTSVTILQPNHTTIIITRLFSCLSCLLHSLSGLDVVALDSGVHPHTDHQHVVARGEAEVTGRPCKSHTGTVISTHTASQTNRMDRRTDRQSRVCLTRLKVCGKITSSDLSESFTLRVKPA